MVDRLASVNLIPRALQPDPGLPMDGGRILRAFLSARLRLRARHAEIAAMIGQCVAFALGFIGLFGSPMLIFIAIFVYLAASSEAHMRPSLLVARRAGRRRDDDAIRDAHAGIAHRRGY